MFFSLRKKVVGQSCFCLWQCFSLQGNLHLAHDHSLTPCSPTVQRPPQCTLGLVWLSPAFLGTILIYHLNKNQCLSSNVMRLIILKREPEVSLLCSLCFFVWVESDQSEIEGSLCSRKWKKIVGTQNLIFANHDKSSQTVKLFL